MINRFHIEPCYHGSLASCTYSTMQFPVLLARGNGVSLRFSKLECTCCLILCDRKRSQKDFYQMLYTSTANAIAKRPQSEHPICCCTGESSTVSWSLLQLYISVSWHSNEGGIVARNVCLLLKIFFVLCQWSHW